MGLVISTQIPYFFNKIINLFLFEPNLPIVNSFYLLLSLLNKTIKKDFKLCESKINTLAYLLRKGYF